MAINNDINVTRPNIDILTNNLSNVTLPKASSIKENQGNDYIALLNNKPTSASDHYVPVLFSAEYTSAPENLDDLFKNISQIVLTLLPILRVQATAIQSMTDTQNKILDMIDLISDALKELADATKDMLTKEYQEALEKMREQTRNTSIFGIVLGAIELIAGITMAVVSMGAGSFMGALMAADGAIKMVAAIIALTNPESATENSTVTQLAQNGAFAAFGDNAAIAQMVFSFATLGIGSAGSLLTASGALLRSASLFSEVGFTAFKSILPSLLILTNMGVICYGLVKANTNKDASNSEGMSTDQAASMGVVAWLLSIIVDKTGFKKIMQEKWGMEADLIVEMAAYLAVSLASNVLIARAMANVELPPSLQGSRTYQNIINHVNAFATVASAQGSITQLYVAFLNYFNAVKAQANIEGQAAIEQWNTLNDTKNKLLKQLEEQVQSIINGMGQTIQGLGEDLEKFNQAINQIFIQEMQFNSANNVI